MHWDSDALLSDTRSGVRVRVRVRVGVRVTVTVTVTVRIRVRVRVKVCRRVGLPGGKAEEGLAVSDSHASLSRMPWWKL